MENPLMLGKIEGRRRGQQRMRRLDGITNSMDLPRRRAAQEPKAPSLLGEEPDASAALHSDAGVLNEEGAFQRGLFL